MNTVARVGYGIGTVIVLVGALTLVAALFAHAEDTRESTGNTVHTTEEVEVTAVSTHTDGSATTRTTATEPATYDSSRVCSTDTRLCPDGTVLHRQLPNCTFNDCPKIIVEPYYGEEDFELAVTPPRQTEEMPVSEEPEPTAVQQTSTPLPAVKRQPTEEEVTRVIETGKAILEQPRREVAPFDDSVRASLITRAREQLGLPPDETMHVASSREALLKSPVAELEVLLAYESGSTVSVTEPRRTVAQRERTQGDELYIQRLVYRDRTAVSVLHDSDHDGLSDYDEVFLYGTDPYNAYTAGGVLTDGERVALGLDPRTTSPERVEVGSPRVMGEIDTRFHVTNIELVETGGEGDVIRFQGLAPLNSVVTLVLFSEPIVVTVKANENGNWEYVMRTSVEEGGHELFVTAVNATGDVVSRSSPIPFLRTAGAVEFTPLSGNVAQEGVFAGNMLPISLGLFMLLGVISLFLIGSQHRRAQQVPLREELQAHE